MYLIRSLSGRLAASTALALTATSLAFAQTQAAYTVFNDTFAAGSTINSNPTSPTAPSINAAAYQIITSQSAHPTGTPSIAAPAGSTPGKLRIAADTTLGTSGSFIAAAAQAIFSQYPVKLAADNDYIEATVTFTAETALLTDSTSATAANAPFTFVGLYNTTVTTSATGANRDTYFIPETSPATSFPLSAYVHTPTPAIAGGQTSVSTGNNLGNIYPAYWRGYTSRHYRTGGRSQAYVHVWSGTAGTNNSGNDTALNPTTTSTLANLTASQQYTAVFRITRGNTTTANSPTTGTTQYSTRLTLTHNLYAGATATGTPLSTYTTSAVSSNSQHAGVVYDALAVGMRLNGNTTSGFTQIMAVNSITITTTGISVIVPQITTQPASQNAAWGDPLTFSVVANGGGDTGSTLSYQWRKNGFNITGATSSTYTIPVLDYSDAGNYSVVVTNSAGSTTSADAVLVVNPPAPPTIAAGGNPSSITVVAGNSASFTMIGSGAGLSYKWQKSTDGVTFTDIPGATSTTYTIARTQGSSAGQYRGVVMNTSGSAFTTAATLTLTFNFAGITPSGYAASASGGGSATAVEVTTLANFKAQAESSSDAVITVNGTINLGGTKVSVKSNKTIQGKDGEATIIGNLELASGVSNVIIRGLNITNPSGTGLTISGASNVYINHVSFYDCGDTLLSVIGGADNVTVSWSEFYFNAASTSNKGVLIGNSAETKPINVTLSHNWWSDKIDTQMPDTTYGRVHMYNNLFQNDAATAMNNTSGTKVRANAQLFSERNQYTNVKDPVTKESSSIGSVRVIGDVYTSTSGTTYAGADFLSFAPTYSYQLLPTTSVTASITAGAGNLAGASTSTPVPVGTASVTSTATTVPLGGSFTLTAITTGLSVAPSTPVPPYQWRLNGTPIGAASADPTLTIGGATGSNTGNYTVAVLLATGETIVSTPITITATSGSSAVPSSQSEAAGGGGAPSLWFLGALGFLAALRRFFRR